MDTRKHQEVRHWVQKAIALYESSDRERALAQIADPKGLFIDGTRYIFALDLEGKLLAHPFLKELVGSNLTDLRDSEGRSFIRKLLSRAKNRGYGFVDYMWQVPNSTEDLHKTVFFKLVDGMILCSGFYDVKGSPIEALYMSKSAKGFMVYL